MAHTGPAQETPLTPSADLALLVATERELESKLAAAGEHARATVETARTEATQARTTQDQELNSARQQFEAEVAAESDRRSQEVLAEGERQAAWFDALSEARVTELAGLVVSRLLATESP
jgi:vacuolar-type H+-ATPase subunit H